MFNHINSIIIRISTIITIDTANKYFRIGSSISHFQALNPFWLYFAKSPRVSFFLFSARLRKPLNICPKTWSCLSSGLDVMCFNFNVDFDEEPNELILLRLASENQLSKSILFGGFFFGSGHFNPFEIRNWPLSFSDMWRNMKIGHFRKLNTSQCETDWFLAN